MYNQKYYTPVFAEDTAGREPLSRRKILILLSALAVFIITVALTLYSIEGASSVKYGQAVALMDSDVLKAKESFLKLGAYRDSSLRARECQNMYDYEYASALLDSGDYETARSKYEALGDYRDATKKVTECDYEAAAALKDQGKLEEAMHAFLVLGSFSDSKEQAENCRNEIDYIAAADLLARQDYANALDAFKALSNYKDSPDKAQVCMDFLYGADYAAAVKLFKKKSYAKALTAFTALEYYKDSADKAQECQNNIDYIAADKAYRAGKFYTAFLAFKELQDFSDSVKRAAKCIQKNPVSGEVYRNRYYLTYTCAVTFIAPKSDYSVCLKVYKSKTLVSTVFIAPGKKAVVLYPAGTFTIKQATGVTWFGPKETFGTDVTFRTLKKTPRFKIGASYSVKL